MAVEFSTEAFQAFAFYSGILILKYMLLSPLTSVHRFRKKAFINPEDIAHNKKLRLVTNDDDVERVRRAQRNDMEIILPFLCIGWLYCYTNPVLSTATLLFKIFTWARFIHTFVYAIYPLPQPSRALSWAVSLIINVYMTFKVINYFW